MNVQFRSTQRHLTVTQFYVSYVRICDPTQWNVTKMETALFFLTRITCRKELNMPFQYKSGIKHTLTTFILSHLTINQCVCNQLDRSWITRHGKMLAYPTYSFRINSKPFYRLTHRVFLLQSKTCDRCNILISEYKSIDTSQTSLHSSESCKLQ